MKHEIVYRAICQGLKSRKEISYSTGLNRHQIGCAITYLASLGKIESDGQIKNAQGKMEALWTVAKPKPPSIFAGANSIFNLAA
jgi:hypothetical protein